MQRLRLSLLLLLTLIAAGPILVAARGPRFVANRAPTTYVITIHEASPTVAQVTAAMTLQSALLFMTHEGPYPKAYAPFVQNLRVVDEAGNELTVQPCTPWQILRCDLWRGWERGQKWRVDARPGTPVRVEYDLSLTHQQVDWDAGIDSAAFVTEWGTFFTGRSLFVMNGQIRSPFVAGNLAWMEGVLVPAADSRRDVAVRFVLPAAWRATTPWEPTASGDFVARDLVDLSESMIMLGQHESFATQQGGTETVWALGGDSVIEAGAALRAGAEFAQAFYTELLGGPPMGQDSQPFERVMVIINASDGVDGEVIGHHISLTVDESQAMLALDADFVMPAHTVLHEFFHLWNGVTFASTNDAEWFKEGLTEYYSLRAARDFGYLSQADFLAVLAKHYRQYATDPGIGELSLRQAGADKHTHHGLVYSGGLFVGLALDLHIRHATQNERSFDDVMRAVYAEYAASGNALDTADVQRIAEATSGLGLDDFFTRYVSGTERIPVVNYLEMSGLRAVVDDASLTVSRFDAVTEQSNPILDDVFGSKQ